MKVQSVQVCLFSPPLTSVVSTADTTCLFTSKLFALASCFEHTFCFKLKTWLVGFCLFSGNEYTFSVIFTKMLQDCYSHGDTLFPPKPSRSSHYFRVQISGCAPLKWSLHSDCLRCFVKSWMKSLQLSRLQNTDVKTTTAASNKTRKRKRRHSKMSLV